MVLAADRRATVIGTVIACVVVFVVLVIFLVKVVFHDPTLGQQPPRKFDPNEPLPPVPWGPGGPSDSVRGHRGWAPDSAMSTGWTTAELEDDVSHSLTFSQARAVEDSVAALRRARGGENYRDRFGSSRRRFHR